ncbi:MAG TPA: C4-type zinc ribbon domain-containing protein [Armatimonadota bacterium]
MPQLFALHEVDALLLNLERTYHKLDNGDRARAALDGARDDLRRAEETLRQARVRLGVAESTLKANEEKQKQHNKRLYGGTVVNTREAEAVEHEIVVLKAAAGDLETEILEAMDAIEAGEAAVKALTKSVADRESELSVIMAAYAKDGAVIKEQASSAMAKRAVAAEPLSAGVMARYDSAKARTRDTGVAMLDGHTCGGCHMQVHGVAMLNLRNSTDIVTCDNCGRILFFRA